MALQVNADVSPHPPKLLDRVREANRLRHGSRSTEKSYVGWIRRYILFQGSARRVPATHVGNIQGSSIETEYKRLSPTPNEFPNFVTRVIAMALKPYDVGADKLKATKAPMFFIHGDADGVRLEHISEMFRLKGDEIHGDLRPRSASRLAILHSWFLFRDRRRFRLF
jgi:hypothetical protein